MPPISEFSDKAGKSGEPPDPGNKVELAKAAAKYHNEDQPPSQDSLKVFFEKEQPKIAQRQKKMKQKELAQLIERLEQVFKEPKSSESSDSEEEAPMAVPKTKISPPSVTLKVNKGRPLTFNPSVSLLSPLQAGLKQAAEQGEDIQGYVLQCPVFEAQDQEGNAVTYHTSIPFKQLKELKTACAQYGPTDPFTRATLDGLSTEALPPADWKQLTHACLGGLTLS